MLLYVANPFVRPSHWYFIEINAHIFKLIPPSGGHDSNFERYRNSLSGGAIYTGGGRKDFRFSTEIAVYLGNGTRIWNVNRKSQAADRSVSVPVTLTDFERRDAKGQNFMSDFHNYAQMVRPRATKFGVITHAGK